MRIGIGVTTHNRGDVARETIDRLRTLMPAGARLVVVDDASTAPFPGANYRFDQNAGIARAKNKCLELLADGCDHIFLFDDDTYPKVADWWKPYVESSEPHLMYVFTDFANGRQLGDTATVYDDGTHVAHSHARGCMLYFDRDVLDVVGGFDTAFGKWGWEHINLSDRIHHAGLTTFAYMDVCGSAALIHSGDEHVEVKTTVPNTTRGHHMARNEPLYRSRAGSGYYVEYRSDASWDAVVTCYFTGTPDPQRGECWEADESLLAPLVDSVFQCGTTGATTVLHDCFAEPATPRTYCAWRVPTGNLSPYWQRWVSIYQWLTRNPTVRNVWCVDATDVEMLRDPFPNMEPGVIYVGDESALTNIPWMRSNHPARFLQGFFAQHFNSPLLNCGLVGGSRENVMEFIREMLTLYAKNRGDVKFNRELSVGETDMGLFNYVCRTKFASRIEHGPKVNTTFKRYKDNGVAWWKHK